MDNDPWARRTERFSGMPSEEACAAAEQLIDEFINEIREMTKEDGTSG